MRFSFHVLFLALVCLVSVVLALDSATVVNGISNAGQVGQVVAGATGHSDLVALITVITTAATTIASFLFGHSHGRKAEKKSAGR